MPTTMLSFVFVAIGGAAGAMARYSFNVFLQREISFPWGTLTANLLGCLIMGGIAQLVAASSWFNDAGIVPDQYRLLFAVGFCGSFTTLSALVLELHTLLQRNEFVTAFSYVMATMLGGFVCFLLGLYIVRALMAGS